jgi:hypothetical protein
MMSIKTRAQHPDLRNGRIARPIYPALCHGIVRFMPELPAVNLRVPLANARFVSTRSASVHPPELKRPANH